LSIGGGLQGVPNPHLIESALARPYTGYYPRIWQKAAALVESMARNHGFADGNKRTTLILLHTLLQRSGYTLEAVGCEDIQTAVGGSGRHHDVRSADVLVEIAYCKNLIAHQVNGIYLVAPIHKKGDRRSELLLQ